MILSSRYYEESLYPLQDGVLKAIGQSDTDFFLTGGTALSRAYYHHRYSDDLDFFVNSAPDYDEQLDTALDKLREEGFFWSEEENYIRNKDFLSFKVGWKKDKTLLKLDFVNDRVPHFGDFVKTELFYRIDSVHNMLSNKLTCLFRYAGKDVADIREIALHESVNWKQALQDAREKEAGLEIPIITEILQGMPQQEFEDLNWIKKPDWRKFREDIDKIVFDLASGQ